MKTIKRVLCVGLLVATGASYAQPQASTSEPAFRPGWYVAPMGSYTRGDRARDGTSGIGGALVVGNRGEVATLELAGIYTSFSGAKGSSGSAASLGGGELGLLLGPFFEHAILSRFFGVVGIGVFKQESSVFGDVGLGYMQPVRLLGIDGAVRSEVRYRYDVRQAPVPEGSPAQFQDVVLNLGLLIPLSRAPEALPEPKPVAVVAP